MLTWMTLIFLSHGVMAQLNVSQIPEGVPILYNKLANAQIAFDAYRIIYAVNLTDYYDLEKQIGSAIEGLKARCTRNRLNSAYCNTTVLQLENRLKESTYDDENLAGYRIKRFCHWCGNFLHYSTGVVDSDSAKAWTEYMNSVKNETSLQAREIFNQTAIFKMFIEANNQTTEKTQQALNRLRTSLHNIGSHEEQQISNIQDRLIDQEIFQLAEAALNHHERIHNKLRTIMTNTKRGRIPEIIKGRSLSKQLREISLALPSNQRLPIDLNHENPLHIFKFSEVSAILYEDHILLTIMIPIAENEKYNLFKATAVPIVKNGQRFIAKISTEHFLLNSDHTKFIPINREEMNNAKMHSPRSMLYHPSASIITNPQILCEWRVFAEVTSSSSTENCEFTPLLTREMLITIMPNEQYFVSTANGLKLRETCGATDKVHTIQDRALIKIDSQCTFKTNNFEIRAHRVRMVNTTETIIPEFSATSLLKNKLPQLAAASYTKLTLNTTTPIIIHNTDEMNEIIKRTQELLEREDHEFKLKDLQYDNLGWPLDLIITLIVVSTVIVISVAGGAYFVLKKLNVMKVEVKTIGSATEQIPKQIQSITPGLIHNYIHGIPASAPPPENNPV